MREFGVFTRDLYAIADWLRACGVKTVQQMNPRLDRVVSDVTGQTGMRIIKAILSGERDVAVLGAIRDASIDVFGPCAVATLRFEVRYRLDGMTYDSEAGSDVLVLGMGDDGWRIVWRT